MELISALETIKQYCGKFNTCTGCVLFKSITKECMIKEHIPSMLDIEKIYKDISVIGGADPEYRIKSSKEVNLNIKISVDK